MLLRRLTLYLLLLLLGPPVTWALTINGPLTVIGPQNHCTSAVGTDSYACTIPLASGMTFALTTNTLYTVTVDVANTEAATINLNSTGAITIKKVRGATASDLLTGDLRAGHRALLLYDGTNMQCLNCHGNEIPILSITQAEADALESCTEGQRYNLSDATSPTQIQQICNTNGDGLEQLYTPTPATVPGVHSESTGVLGLQYTSGDCLTTSTLLGNQRTHCVTVGSGGLTVTLPLIDSAPIAEYLLVIDDDGVGKLTLCPSGSDLLNNVNACKTMEGEDSIAVVWRVGTKWRLVMAQVQEESTATTGAVRVSVRDAVFPAANPAVLDLSEPRPKLLFDDTTSECAIFPFTMPLEYVGSPVAYAIVTTAATSGTGAFDFSLWADNPGSTANPQTESYAAANICTFPANAGSGDRSSITCTLTNADSVAALALVNLKVCRNVANDSITGDVRILTEMQVRYAK